MNAPDLMLSNEHYSDFLAVLETSDAPHSLFEQYYGLLLADVMLADVDTLERRPSLGRRDRARGAKATVQTRRSAMSLSQKVLARLAEPS